MVFTLTLTDKDFRYLIGALWLLADPGKRIEQQIEQQTNLDLDKWAEEYDASHPAPLGWDKIDTSHD